MIKRCAVLIFSILLVSGYMIMVTGCSSDQDSGSNTSRQDSDAEEVPGMVCNNANEVEPNHDFSTATDITRIITFGGGPIGCVHATDDPIDIFKYVVESTGDLTFSVNPDIRPSDLDLKVDYFTLESTWDNPEASYFAPTNGAGVADTIPWHYAEAGWICMITVTPGAQSMDDAGALNYIVDVTYRENLLEGEAPGEAEIDEDDPEIPDIPQGGDIQFQSS